MESKLASVVTEFVTRKVEAMEGQSTLEMW